MLRTVDMKTACGPFHIADKEGKSVVFPSLRLAGENQ